MDRLKHLEKLKDGNEHQIVAIEIGLQLGEIKKAKAEADEKRLGEELKGLKDKDLEKKEAEKEAAKQMGWAIVQKVKHMKEEKKDLTDALEVINKEIKDEKQKGE